MFALTKNKVVTLLSAVALFASLNISAETLRETFSAQSGGELYLRTDVGRLTIDTHSSNEVILEVQVKGEDADDFELTHDVNGDRINVYGKVEGRKGWGWNRQLKVEFRVTVPKEFNLEMHTSGGSIDIEDLIGNVDAHTSGGSIDVGNIQGDVTLKTSGGSIQTEEIHGEIDAHTSGGSIRVTMTKQPTKDAELSTSGGSITAYLMEDIQIDIDASTSGGRVRSDFDVDGRVKKQSIRGEINGGGPRLELHTSGGSVSIKKN
ncbi:DUF4097 family beta strand repeat-containing protein [Aliiglaciecola sp. M165]|uniref:DUF4097 family beta strand repeat-containing protein n=1 Tax=Aliiglaciecola sp. M165 TaxID=2593649 RepID=UPI00118102D4|nr:DUF4097 family beta strand repeat-containing protein [Aliiglaciecola sp. M165]TRY28895.1 DUF4097 domain-containing protein [Aliiglaciecola sp. M165]